MGEHDYREEREVLIGIENALLRIADALDELVKQGNNREAYERSGA